MKFNDICLNYLRRTCVLHYITNSPVPRGQIWHIVNFDDTHIYCYHGQAGHFWKGRHFFVKGVAMVTGSRILPILMY